MNNPKSSNTTLAQTPTYALYQQDSHGVAHLVRRGLSYEEANRERQRVYPDVMQVMIREHNGQSLEPKHPASAFLVNAICHECGHSAAKHQSSRTPSGTCKQCLNFSFSEALDAPDLSTTDAGSNKRCWRNRELVLLDGIIDMAKSEIPLAIMLAETPSQDEPLMTATDPSELGYLLKLMNPDVRQARDAVNNHFQTCMSCELRQDKICTIASKLVQASNAVHDRHCPTMPYPTITAHNTTMVANGWVTITDQ